MSHASEVRKRAKGVQCFLLSTTMSNNLLSIPSELHIKILSNLDAVSLVSCMMTCTCLHDTFKNSSELMYIIELHLDGLKDAGTSIPAADAIALLRRRREAWMSVEWTKHAAFEIRYDKNDVYDLVGGVFAQVHKNSLEIVRLPNSRNKEGHTDKRDLNEMAISCLTMDPTQDLIVLLEDVDSSPAMSDAGIARIHIRAISADALHPLARKSSLRFHVGFYYHMRNDIRHPVLQIAHKILALSFAFSGRREIRTLIWDWTTSKLLLDSAISFDGPFRTRLCCLSLLNSTHLVSASLNDSGSIHLYKLDRSRSVKNSPAVHLATLRLPFLISPNSEILRISMHAGPILAHPLPDTPFMANDEDRLFVFCITYWRISSDYFEEYMDHASLFVHQRVFTRYISQHASLGGPPLDIPWEEWGPSNTCLTTDKGVRETRRLVDGQRVVLCHLSGSSSSTSESIEIRDFSRAAIYSLENLESDFSTLPTFSRRTNNWKLSQGDFFKATDEYEIQDDYPYFGHDVWTHLKYACTTRHLQEACTEFMVYADNVLAIKVNNN